MPALVARLAEVAPGIKLRLTPYGNDLTETGVVSGITAMVLGRITDPPDNLVVQHLMDETLECVVRAGHPEAGDTITREAFERLRHVNVVPPGPIRTGLQQALASQGLRREVALSVTTFAAVAEMIAATDYCTTLPRLICNRLRHDPAHRWLRGVVGAVVAGLGR